ncbi:DUF1415 domain-containing protein [Saccharospirillum mangrovi]|uniref:DUF1415 domain-containing protein n=1 Tax=Saccharospirillum mangrovi TaxID=2161747 RepID=UPI0018E58615|nr:DUF1415 domain-containing protein [Saccharospirillum mangrovi]
MIDQTNTLQAVRRWVDRLVVGENLCPFAKRELVRDRVRFVVSEARNETDLLTDLGLELNRLQTEPDIETTLLIHPAVLTDFLDFNDFLDQADALLRQLKLEGEFQIATFHPHYQFADTEPDAAENYTNRSPYPILHLLREDSLETAIDRYPDTGEIPERNIARMEAMGVAQLKAILAECYASDA